MPRTHTTGDVTVLTYSEKYAQRSALIAGFLDQFGPTIDQLHALEDEHGWSTLDIQVWSSHAITLTIRGDDPRETMRTLRRLIGGKWDKGGYGDTFSISRKWGDNVTSIKINLEANREKTCEKVVTGHKTVYHDAVEARPARKEVIEKVEWVCGNLLDD
jgi:hypothetical protein